MCTIASSSSALINAAVNANLNLNEIASTAPPHRYTCFDWLHAQHTRVENAVYYCFIKKQFGAMQLRR